MSRSPQKKSSSFVLVVLFCSLIVFLNWHLIVQDYDTYFASPGATQPIRIAVAASPVALAHASMDQPSTRTAYEQMARQAALNAGINPELFVQQIQQESNFQPQARSSAGALGMAQLMPQVAHALGVDPFQPAQALPAAARLMAGYLARYHGDEAKALAAYNAGTHAVDTAIARGGPCWFWFLPTETQQYIQRILAIQWPACQ